MASDLGYSVPTLPLKPRAALKFATASGSGENGAVGTFNPLYPRGAYLDLSTLIGPSNFISLNPYVNLHPVSSVSTTAGMNFLWRESTADGIYNPGMGIVRRAGGSRARSIGSELALTSNWQIDTHVNLLGGYAHLFPASFIWESGPALASDYFYLYAYFVF